MSARILIVGFSVTEGGFGAKLKNALLHAGLASEVDVVGLGGNHPQGLMYLFDTVGSDQTYDHIVFEINTSDFRKYKSGAAAVFPFLVLAAKTRARGAEPLFINLPRGDVDPETDDTGRLRGIGLDRMDVANLDIDRQAYAHFGADVMRETFFKDDGYFVHPHGVNEDWLVRQSTEALSAVIGRPAGKTDLDLANSFSVLRLSDLRPDLPVYDF